MDDRDGEAPKFDNESWNRTRIALENKALEAIENLSNYMRCNHINLPYGRGNWIIRHSPE